MGRRAGWLAVLGAWGLCALAGCSPSRPEEPEKLQRRFFDSKKGPLRPKGPQQSALPRPAEAVACTPDREAGSVRGTRDS